MKKYEVEYTTQCPKCQTEYSDTVLWKVCPVCGVQLKQVRAQLGYTSEYLRSQGQL
jgi:rRNA maturation endonuclease Nob1